MPIQAVIFDMDGVLIDSYQAHWQSWLDAAESEGVRCDPTEFAKMFGRTSREIIAHFWGEGRCSATEVAAIDAQKEAAFREIINTDFPAMPGAADLLRTLHRVGFRLAVGSSGPPENVELVVDRLGVRDLFSVLVTGCDVVRGKPDPQVFLLAAERLNVSPTCCAVVEDAPAGVAAANAAGMFSIGLLSTGRTPSDLKAAGAVIRSLSEITPQMLQSASR
ncbi:MAG: HAD family phosphatase [Thermoguttaceae bacterium]